MHLIFSKKPWGFDEEYPDARGQDAFFMYTGGLPGMSYAGTTFLIWSSRTLVVCLSELLNHSLRPSDSCCSQSTRNSIGDVRNRGDSDVGNVSKG